MERLRNELEAGALGSSRWDDATRLNRGDNASVGRLLRERHSGAIFTSMLVYDAQADDVMKANLDWLDRLDPNAARSYTLDLFPAHTFIHAHGKNERTMA